MKYLLALSLITLAAPAFAGEAEQNFSAETTEKCPDCRPHPHPRPQPVATCHVSMLDCYNRPTYRYWGKGPTYQGACQAAMNLCQYELRWYGQYGSRCVINR